MKTDVRLLSLRSLLLLEASLLQHARLIRSDVTSSHSHLPRSVHTKSSPLPTHTTCAPCTVSVDATQMSVPFVVIVLTEMATATVIPYITKYPDGTNVTSYSTYSNYVANASHNAPFTAPTTTPLVWTFEGLSLTYPTTYLAFQNPKAGINRPSGTNPISHCRATSLTIIPDIPIASLIIPFHPLATTTSTHKIIQATATDASLARTPASSSSSVTDTFQFLTSSVFSYFDTLPQLSSIVSTNPHLCSHTVGGYGLTGTIPTPGLGGAIPVKHTTVDVLTQTGSAVVSVMTAIPMNRGAPHADGTGSSTKGSSVGSGNSVGPGVVTAAGHGKFITIGPTSFLVSAVQNHDGSDIVIGDGYATLAPGSSIAINGVPVSFELSDSTTALVVDSSTIPLNEGTTTSLAAEESSQTGNTGPTAFVNAASTSTKSHVGSLNVFVCLIVLVFGVTGGLVIAL